MSGGPEPKSPFAKKAKRNGKLSKEGGSEDDEGLVDVEGQKMKREARPTMLLAPVYNGVAAGLAIFFVGNGVSESIRLFFFNLVTVAERVFRHFDTGVGGRWSVYTLCAGGDDTARLLRFSGSSSSFY
jgi:hypothetical protein